MKSYRLVLPLAILLAVLLAGCGLFREADAPSDVGANSSENGSASEQSNPVETVEPFPYGGPIQLDDAQREAADFAASLLSGNLLWELPPFRSYAELENEHGDVLLQLLSAREGDLLRAGGRVSDLTALPEYDETEAAQASANARFYTLSSASELLHGLFGAETDVHWETLAEQLPGRILPNTGVICIQSLGTATAETYALPVGFGSEDDGWAFQFVVCTRMKEETEWLDYVSGASLGTPDTDETMEEFATRQLPSLGLITATVLKNADGSFYLDRLEGTYEVGVIGADE